MSDLLATASEPTVADVTNVISAQRLVYIEFTAIRDFSGHAFHLYTGERLNDMVESVRQNGILLPLIVRRIHDDPDYDYEMLSGHNRKNAGMLAGLDGALCLVKDGITNEEALMYVVETNLMQRSFADMLPSERAAGLAMRYSEMFSQGKRNDIIRELQLLGGEFSDQTCGTEFHKSLSRDSLGDKYSLTGRSVANYIRLNKLAAPLKERLDKNALPIKAGVHISYLPESEQLLVDSALSETRGKLSEAQAAEIRRKSEAYELDEASN
jgi:ParB family chromosome partitioning protein